MRRGRRASASDREAEPGAAVRPATVVPDIVAQCGHESSNQRTEADPGHARPDVGCAQAGVVSGERAACEPETGAERDP